MRYTGPKDRLSRRENFDLFDKGAKLTRLSVPPGVHGPKGTRKTSEYGRQLREKQKVKRMYGLTEKQFARYVAQAQKAKGNTGEALIQLLERRLDNVVYRLGFAPTRPSARQLVSHGHVLVDGEEVTIASYSAKEGQTISLDTTAQNISEVKGVLAKERSLAGWLEKKAVVGRIKNLPKKEDVLESISEQDVIEFYSR